MSNSYDIFMLIVMAAAIAWGLYKGLAWQVASFCSIVMSYVVAIQFRQQVGEMLGIDPPWNRYIAMLALYIGCSLGVWLLFRLVAESLDKLKLKDFDRQIGALVGAAKGLLLCIIITMFAMSFVRAETRQKIVSSHSGYIMSQIIDKTEPIIPEEVHKVVHPYFDKFQQQLDGNQQPLLNLQGIEDNLPNQLQGLPDQLQNIQTQAQQFQTQVNQYQNQATQIQQQAEQFYQQNQQQIDAARDLYNSTVNPNNTAPIQQPYQPPNTSQFVPPPGVQYIQSNGQVIGN